MIETMVALSFGPAVERQRRMRLRARAEAALEAFSDSSHTQRLVDRDDLLVLVRGSFTQDTSAPLDLGHPTPAVAGVRLPPAATMKMDARGMRIRCDREGLRQVCLHRSPDCAVVSTSALVVGTVMERPLSEPSFGAIALMGYLLEESTLFDGVERLPGGHEAVLEGGTAVVVPVDVEGDRSWAENGAAAIRESVRTCLDFADDAALELSGGLDSRMILAAIPPTRRPGRVAVTLGRPSDPDVRVASRLAGLDQLDHRVLEPLAGQPADLDQVISAARRLEHASDPLAAYTLWRAEEQLPQGPRFSGVNGEAARGTFYPGSGRSRAITRARVARLAEWRLFANHRADDRIFAKEWLASQESLTIDRVTSILEATGKPWRAATDEYRRTQRMRNWAGLNYSAAASSRTVLAPFLHPAFLSWVAGLPTSRRAGSRAFTEALVELDPQLGALPLDSGLRPEQLVGFGITSRLARARLLGGKAGRKILQRVRHQRRPASRSITLLESAQSALRELDLSSELPQAPWLNLESAQRAVLEGLPLDQPTVGLLVNLVGIQRFRTAVETGVVGG